jgi:hypothetical protein
VPVNVTDAMNMGSAYHSILEGKFDDVIEIPPEVLAKNGAKSTKAFKEFASEHEGKYLVTKDEFDVLLRMFEAIRENQEASEMLDEEGVIEPSIFADVDGLWWRCRPDKITQSAIVDWKTTTNASPGAFAKSAWNFRYDIQQIIYQMILREHNAGSRPFKFVVQEKSAPYRVGVYQLDPDWLASTYDYVETKIIELKAAIANNNFTPSWYGGTVVVQRPRFAQYQEEYNV